MELQFELTLPSLKGRRRGGCPSLTSCWAQRTQCKRSQPVRMGGEAHLRAGGASPELAQHTPAASAKEVECSAGDAKGRSAQFD